MIKIFVLVFCLLSQHSVVAAPKSPLVIGHRGASGYRPEHTIASYELAIEQGADYIEPDLVMTKDGVLIVRHENEISGTTDVASKFPNRKTTKSIDGEKIEGWFSEDFTLSEIKSLRASERLAKRDHSFDGKFEIPTFEEVILLAKKKKVGIYPEMKHPSYFSSISLPLEPEVIRVLKKYQLDKIEAAVFLQSFELTALQNVRKEIGVKTVFLLGEPNAVPFDLALKGEKKTYLNYTSADELKKLAKDISGIGPHKNYLISIKMTGGQASVTSILKWAHEAGLLVHPYTFRSEAEYLASHYKNDPQNEYLLFYEHGVDGVFSDFPDHAVKARSAFLKKQKN
jgi:glycerophosphoryl diester phosphodiesterase